MSCTLSTCIHLSVEESIYKLQVPLFFYAHVFHHHHQILRSEEKEDAFYSNVPQKTKTVFNEHPVVTDKKKNNRQPKRHYVTQVNVRHILPSKLKSKKHWSNLSLAMKT